MRINEEKVSIHLLMNYIDLLKKAINEDSNNKYIIYLCECITMCQKEIENEEE